MIEINQWMRKIFYRVAVLILVASTIAVACSPNPIGAQALGSQTDLISGVSNIKSGKPTWQADIALTAASLPCFEVQELTLKNDGVYVHPFLDVTFEAHFTSPSGKEQDVPGFYYAEDLWKVRFRPDEPGQWVFTYLAQGVGGFQKQGRGTFTCTPVKAQGRVRQNPVNPYQWVFENGEPYFPVGLQDCVKLVGNQLPGGFIDGEQRNDGKARKLTQDEYFRIYGEAGFNLYRFSQHNCSLNLYKKKLDNYLVPESLATDELLSLARKHGFRVMYGFFGFYKRPATDPGGKLMEKEKRFIRYSIARWGVYVDFWELLNESRVPDDWTTEMANYVREIDPDKKPISTSFPMPELQVIDISAPHWYELESELKSDLVVKNRAKVWKQYGKPVIFGEQGNQGMNWDPTSGLRMRIRSWTALFQEVSLVFWNTSWSKFGMFQGTFTPNRAANIYLGPEERGYIRVLRDFSDQLDANIHIVPVEVTPSGQVRAYGLLSERHAAVYLHHFTDHTIPISGVIVTLQLPSQIKAGKLATGKWIDPATGKIVGWASLHTGMNQLAAPEFKVDLALLITVAE